MGTMIEERQDLAGASIPLRCMEIWGGNEPVDDAISVPGIDAFVYARPHAGSAHGGDLHYVSLCGAGNISRFVVADVSGHGESVHAMTTTLRRLMRKHITTVDQSRFIRKLNEEFGTQGGAGFATAVLTTYFAPSDHLIVTNAGHPVPFWFRAALGTWTRLEPQAISDTVVSQVGDVGIRNLPLGVIDGTEYLQFAVKLEKDDLILIYTDSIMEACDPAGKMMGEAGLLELLRTLDVIDSPTLPLRLVEAVVERCQSQLDDDVTVMVLHHNAADPPRLSLPEKMRVMGRMLGLGG